MQNFILFIFFLSFYNIEAKAESQLPSTQNRLLSKIANDKELPDTYGAQNRNVCNIDEEFEYRNDASIPSGVEFQKKSNIFVKADKYSYNIKKGEVTAEDNVVICHDNYILKADHLKYNFQTDQLWAKDHIRLRSKDENYFYCDQAYFQDNFKQGLLYNVGYRFKDNTTISAKLATKLNDDLIIFHKVSYSPCPLCKKGEPLWQIKASETKIDLKKERITYYNSIFQIYNFPIIGFPYFHHPMPGSDACSGILAPSFTNRGLKVPLYLRLNSSSDLTFSPFLGKDYAGDIEFRKLTSQGSLDIQGSYLIEDELRYNVFSDGKFKYLDYTYGYAYNMTSDEDYLKNVLYLEEDTLTSKLFVEKVNKGDFFNFQILKFQNLNKYKHLTHSPSILPMIEFNKTSIFQDQNLDINGHILNIYYGKKIKTNIGFNLFLNNSLDHKGNIFEYNFTLNNIFSSEKLQQKKHKEEISTNAEFKINSQLDLKWKYPFLFKLEKNHVILEPTIQMVLRNLYPASNSRTYDNKSFRGEYDIFNSKQYRALTEFKKSNYLNIGFFSNFFTKKDINFETFIGRRFNIKPFGAKKNNNIIKIAFKYKEFGVWNRNVFNLKSNSLNEFGVKYKKDNLFLKSYYLYTGSNGSKKKIAHQINSRIEIPILKNIIFNFENRIDFSKEKMRLIHNKFGVTYKGECASIAFKYSKNLVKKKPQEWNIIFALQNINF